MKSLGLAAGIVIVLANWASLVATVVLPRGRTRFQRLSWWLTWSVYRTAVLLSRIVVDFKRRDGLLAAVAPLAVVLQLFAFLALFVLGFALMLLPWQHHLALAVAQAGSGVFTLGLARSPGETNDVLVVLAACSGSVTIALQIGYLPTLYQAYGRRESLVTLMESRAGVPAWGPEVLMRHQLVHTTDALADLYRDWEAWSADIAESHGTHPVLLLFRSPVAGYSWLLSLLAVLDAAAIHLAVRPESAPSEARLCLRMGFSALRRIAYTLDIAYDRDPMPEGPIELTKQEFVAAVGQLAQSGFDLERDLDAAWTQFVGWRVNYESIAYALADRLAVPQVPWSGRRSHETQRAEMPHRPPHRSPGGKVREDLAFRTAALDAVRPGEPEGPGAAG